MKIFDCFMYFDEEIVLDARLNCLNPHVDYFIIIESCFTHRGDRRELNFDINKYKKFKDKIIYKVYDQIPNKIDKVFENDDETTKSIKYIIKTTINSKPQKKTISEKIIFFKQDMFYYKFNLKIPNFKWTGTKACRKKDLINPQWLRNIKDRKYPFYRLDTFFSKTKYMDIKFIEKGGWHFSNVKTAEEIEHKLKSYLHHREFDVESLTTEEIKKIMENKQAIYDLTVDKRQNKIGTGSKLVKLGFEELPEYIKNNREKYKNWLD